MIQEIAVQIWQVWTDTAMWLCLGLLVAGLAHLYLRTDHLKKWLATPGPGSVIRAAILGAPLPLCSCGVLPAAIGLRRAGASQEASAAFLISTPETGVDSVAVSWALLGPIFAILRPFAALMTAIAAGLAVWRWGGEAVASGEEEVKSCCSTEGATEGSAEETHPTANARPTFLSGLGYAFTDLLDDLSGWLVFGIVLAGVILTLVPPELLAQFGHSPWALLLMLVVGVPLYVCAVASTPIAAALLVSGVSPGAVLVFLLAGPATNLGGLGLIAKEFGRRFAGIYLATICVFSLGLGFAVNGLLPAEWFVTDGAAMAHHDKTDWLADGFAIGLAVWMAWRFAQRVVSK